MSYVYIYNPYSFVYYLLLHHMIALPFGVASDTLATDDPDIVDGDTETHVYEKHDKLLHGDRSERKSVFE